MTPSRRTTTHHKSHEETIPDFWLFTPPGPLPELTSINHQMLAIDPYSRLCDHTGKLEEIPDGLLRGECLDEEGEPGFEVWWGIQIAPVHKVFNRNPKILKTLGENTQMIVFSLEDELALGHVFAMLHALLTLRSGILVIPEGQQQIMLSRQQALEFLREEIQENLSFPHDEAGDE